MTGCYGNHPEDRHFEALLHQHLEETDQNNDSEMTEVEVLQQSLAAANHRHKNDDVAARMLLGLLDSAKETIARMEAAWHKQQHDLDLANARIKDLEGVNLALIASRDALRLGISWHVANEQAQVLRMSHAVEELTLSRQKNKAVELDRDALRAELAEVHKVVAS